ncbi:unnamed protein product [Musa hybrid cultivar]
MIILLLSKTCINQKIIVCCMGQPTQGEVFQLSQNLIQEVISWTRMISTNQGLVTMAISRSGDCNDSPHGQCTPFSPLPEVTNPFFNSKALLAQHSAVVFIFCTQCLGFHRQLTGGVRAALTCSPQRSSLAEWKGEERGRSMSYGCKSSVSCVDARRPARPTYVNLYRWPESDAEFVKSMTGGRDERVGDDNLVDGRRRWSPSPRVVDSYSCRQMYLRSYTFSKEETATEKARQCLGKAKRRAVVLFPFLQQKTEGRSCVPAHADTKMSRRSSRRKEKKRKVCGTDKKPREISYSALFSIFFRFLFCTSSVEVVDRR